MTSESKWLMFKNYMHNELGIGKEEIRDWIKDAVREQADRLLAKEFGRFDIAAELRKIVYEKNLWGKPDFGNDMRNRVAKLLTERIRFKVEDVGDNGEVR